MSEVRFSMKALVFIYRCLIALFAGVWIWGLFDIHNRLPLVLMVQAVVLLVRVPVMFMRRH